MPHKPSISAADGGLDRVRNAPGSGGLLLCSWLITSRSCLRAAVASFGLNVCTSLSYPCCAAHPDAYMHAQLA